MATYSYTSVGTVNTSSVNGNNINAYIVVNARNSIYNTSTINDLSVYIDAAIVVLEGIYGGTITYVIGDSYNIPFVGDFTDITFTWDGITVDPSTIGNYGSPISMQFSNDDGTYFGFNWEAVVATTTTTCPTCLELTKSACQSTYTFVAGLTATTDYWVVIENNRNRRYIQQVTTDGSGDFVIDATAPEFPEGFFIPEQFVYTLKVYTDADLTTEAEITYNNTIYNCIALSFIYSTTTTSSIDVSVDLWVNDSLDFVIDDTFNTISVG